MIRIHSTLLMCALLAPAARAQTSALRIVMTDGQQYNHVRVVALDGRTAMLESSATLRTVTIDSIDTVSDGVPGPDVALLYYAYAASGVALGSIVALGLDEKGNFNWVIPAVCGAAAMTLAVIIGVGSDDRCIRFSSLSTTEQDSVFQCLLWEDVP